MIKDEREQIYDYLLSKHHGHTVALIIGRKGLVHTGRLSYNPSLCTATVCITRWDNDKSRTLCTISFELHTVVNIRIDQSDYAKIMIN